MHPDCRVSNCKIPKDQERIKKNLEIWKQAQKYSGPSTTAVHIAVHIADHSLSNDDFNESLIAKTFKSPQEPPRQSACADCVVEQTHATTTKTKYTENDESAQPQNIFNSIFFPGSTPDPLPHRLPHHHPSLYLLPFPLFLFFHLTLLHKYHLRLPLPYLRPHYYLFNPILFIRNHVWHFF